MAQTIRVSDEIYDTIKRYSDKKDISMKDAASRILDVSEASRLSSASLTEDEMRAIAAEYAMGAIRHIVLEDCDHEEHERLREVLDLVEDDLEQSGESGPWSNHSDDDVDTDEVQDDAKLKMSSGYSSGESPWGNH